MTNIKIVLIGDASIGKTSLIRSFIDNTLAKPYPSTFNNYSTEINFNSNSYTLSIWDTAGADEYNKLRTLSYPHTDIFMICYAIDNIRSYNNIKKWICEIKNINMMFLIVGTKCDVRRNRVTDGDVMNCRKGVDLATKYKTSYLECSVEEKINVNEVFMKSVEMVVTGRKREKIKWWKSFFCCAGV